MEKFRLQFGSYPTATEFEDCSYLPSARQMQRRFGGMMSLRKTLGLEGQLDLTRGIHSSNRAREINKRSHVKEKEVYDYLVSAFGKPFVHREYLFDEQRRVRADFLIYTKQGEFMIDISYPKDLHSLTGCLNAKMRTYDKNLVINHTVIFLMINTLIREEDLERVIRNKTEKLRGYQRLMGMDGFKRFCDSQTALKLSP